ncbi:MAG: tetratricopeptide repeat protein [Bryobacterales bacterium]|nr:tetratricopeptide repeat protein [Bryobacterales bacterium]
MVDLAVGKTAAAAASLAWELGVFLVLGEALCRWIGGFSPLRTRLPEAAFLFGFSGYALFGYAALPFMLSARGIPVAVALGWLCVWFLRAREGNNGAAPDFLEPYLQFRRTRAFLYSAGLLGLMCLAVCASRIPWMLGLPYHGDVLAGAGIFDDVRTLGFPISLAAYGFPLLSPLAVGMQLSYPLGAFLFPAGQIAWFPHFALPILIADSFLSAAFYSTVILLVAGSVLSSSWSRMLLAAAASVSVSFNLWNLGLSPQSDWVNYFYGFFHSNGIYTTIGFTPFTGMLYIPNHALGFASAVLAVLWFTKTGGKAGPALLWGSFTAAVSMDMTVMAGLVCLLLLAPHLVRSLVRRSRPEPKIYNAVLVGAVCFVVFVAVNLPALSGKVDGPFDPLFPVNRQLPYSIGMLASADGPYFLLLALGALLAGSSGQLARRYWGWVVPVLTGLTFCALLEYHSIWFWRFSFAAHCLFGLLCAFQLEQLSRRKQVAYACVSCVVLAAGCLQFAADIRDRWRFAPHASAGRQQAVRWIWEHTPLEARVAEYRSGEASFATAVEFLRTGNRAGFRIYDRSHPLIGYRHYESAMHSLEAGIDSNDYILVAAESRGFAGLLRACGAPVAFEDNEALVFAATSTCREEFRHPELQRRLLDYEKQAYARQSSEKVRDPGTLPEQLLADYVNKHPGEIGYLRRRLDTLWEKGMFEQARHLIEPVLKAHPESAEANYSYAFTLHAGNLDVGKSIGYYDAAERAGYAAFWVHYNRAAALLKLGQYAKARQDAERAVALDPSRTDARRLLESIPRAGAVSGAAR